jgi:hypothetical protein
MRFVWICTTSEIIYYIEVVSSSTHQVPQQLGMQGMQFSPFQNISSQYKYSLPIYSFVVCNVAIINYSPFLRASTLLTYKLYELRK